MSKQVRFRRGTTAQHSVFTGPAGEVTVDTDKNALVVHDGTTAGGIALQRADRPRGFTKEELFTANGTYSITGKTDLKRIIVHCIGGGGGGGGASQCGGGEGGVGFVVIEATALSASTAVTIAAVAGANVAGNTSSFGTFISCSGGQAGNRAASGAGAAGGVATGTGVVNLGAQGSVGGTDQGSAQGRGGGLGGGNAGQAGKNGGGGGPGASGGAGSIRIQEIYGLV